MGCPDPCRPPDGHTAAREERHEASDSNSARAARIEAPCWPVQALAGQVARLSIRMVVPRVSPGLF